MGLVLFTWGFAYTKPNLYWLFVAWVSYPLLGFLLYYTSFKTSLIFGLIFLVYPPVYIASYNSVSSVDLEIVRVQRVFAYSSSPSVSLTVDFAISAPLASLPVTISDMTFGFFVGNSSSLGYSRYPIYLAGESTVKGGTFFPYGHLDYHVTVSSSDLRVVGAINSTWTPVRLDSCSSYIDVPIGYPRCSDPVGVSSLIYSRAGAYSYRGTPLEQPSYSDTVFEQTVCWDWRNNRVYGTLDLVC